MLQDAAGCCRLILFPRQCVHTKGFLRWEFKPVLDRGAPSLHLGSVFSCKLSDKLVLVTCPSEMRFDRAGLHKLCRARFP